MKYQANPVIVDAYKIVGVGSLAAPGGMHLALENGENVVAPPEMTARYTPQPGDYWVIQSDGYVYLNPKEVFERKYSIYCITTGTGSNDEGKRGRGPFTPGEGEIDSQGRYSGDPAGAEILAALPELRRRSNG